MIPIPTVEAESRELQIAQVIDPGAFVAHVFSGDPDWHPDDDRLRRDRAIQTARKILALPPIPTGGEAGLRAALKDVLDRDEQWAPSGSKNDCNCINLSREGEREYETGTCPHQRARNLLAAPSQPPGGMDAGNHDCLAKRRPDEPMFIFLARDPDAHNLVRLWAERRLAAGGDPEHCQMGLDTAARMQAYAADPANRPASAPPTEAYPPIGGVETGEPVALWRVVRRALVKLYGADVADLIGEIDLANEITSSAASRPPAARPTKEQLVQALYDFWVGKAGTQSIGDTADHILALFQPLAEENRKLREAMQQAVDHLSRLSFTPSQTSPGLQATQVLLAALKAKGAA